MDANFLMLGVASNDVSWFFQKTPIWTAVGLLGNAIFTSRFVLQWLYSERRKQVVVPPIFWHLSFWGSLIFLIYAIHLKDVAVILGYFFLPILYGRNLVLLYRKKGEQAT